MSNVQAETMANTLANTLEDNDQRDNAKEYVFATPSKQTHLQNGPVPSNYHRFFGQQAKQKGTASRDSSAKRLVRLDQKEIEEKAQRIYKYNDPTLKQQAKEIKKLEQFKAGGLYQKISNQQKKKMHIKHSLNRMTAEALDENIEHKLNLFKKS